VKEERDAEGKVTKYTIQGISRSHRLVVGLLAVCRLALSVLLTWVGTVFLLQDTDYINLLLNGVGLVFIIEIANCLYGQLLDLELREQCENTEPFSVSMASVWKMFWFRNAAIRDIFGLCCVLGLLAGGMYLHYIHIAKPLSTALECTCLNQGEQCHEATAYNKEFWSSYWADTVPGIFDTVDKMQKEHAEDDDEVPEVVVDAAPAPAVANFIHRGLHGGSQHFSKSKHPEVVPFEHGHTNRKSHHRVTRLLNSRKRNNDVQTAM